MAAEISCLGAAAIFGLAIYEKSLRPMPTISVRHNPNVKSGSIAIVQANAAPILMTEAETKGLPCMKSKGYAVRLTESGPLPSYEYSGHAAVSFEDACRTCDVHTMFSYTDVMGRCHQSRLNWYHGPPPAGKV